MHGSVGRLKNAVSPTALDAVVVAARLDQLVAEINAEWNAARQCEQSFRAMYRAWLVHVIAGGLKLIEFKETVGHGNWMRERAARLPGISHSCCNHWMQLARMYGDSQRVPNLPERVLLKLLQRTRALQSNEYYTPLPIMARVRRVLGTMDPASCAEANEIVQASQIYTLADDGLAQSWFGHVWMNSPYKGQAGPFGHKLMDEFKAGHVTAAIALFSSRDIHTKRFRPFYRHRICHLYQRVRFFGSQVRGNPPWGSVLVCLGDGFYPAFHREFAPIGAVMREDAP
jgi:hypothetical protein